MALGGDLRAIGTPYVGEDPKKSEKGALSSIFCAQNDVKIEALGPFRDHLGAVLAPLGRFGDHFRLTLGSWTTQKSQVL